MYAGVEVDALSSVTELNPFIAPRPSRESKPLRAAFLAHYEMSQTNRRGGSGQSWRIVEWSNVRNIGGGGELDEFERAASAFPALDGDEGLSAPLLEPSFHATPQAPSSFQSPAPAQFQSPAPQGGNYLAFTQSEEPESEVVQQWREHQAEKIAQRDEESKKKREEMIARAEKEIDKFYEECNAKKERTIRENKENEGECLSILTDSFSSGTTWSRICDLVDLENSGSKTVARAGTDLTRYREVLLKLRKQGDKAPGAARS
ncbi:hypothetical protein RSOLAG22IIIB_10230 [Rhizoctonia solani]|uniref:Clathrin light chain n=1 Tax=Rhizoctonia solani TaxID=456999 RepID=A0A0K6G2T8_9AGAM|nr:hypothetical protein RSOLAG22IIIB_10230 [Rhizoctonia solani]